MSSYDWHHRMSIQPHRDEEAVVYKDIERALYYVKLKLEESFLDTHFTTYTAEAMREESTKLLESFLTGSGLVSRYTVDVKSDGCGHVNVTVTGFPPTPEERDARARTYS